MKIRVAALMVSCFVLALYAADEAKPPAAPTNPAFEKLKSLAGEWTWKSPEGKTLTSTYRLSSGGSVLLNTVQVPGEGEMLTAFHADGASVIATHYCLAMNQPTFVAAGGPNPNVITFTFKSATNLRTPETGHMRGVTFRIADAGHHSTEWVWRENGKESVEKFELQRAK